MLLATSNHNCDLNLWTAADLVWQGKQGSITFATQQHATDIVRLVLSNINTNGTINSSQRIHIDTRLTLQQQEAVMSTCPSTLAAIQSPKQKPIINRALQHPDVEMSRPV